MDERRRWKFAKHAFIFSLLGMLLIAGSCGCRKSEKEQGVDPSTISTGPADAHAEELLSESLRSLSEVPSFRIRGEMEMNMSAQEGERLVTVNMHMSLWEDVSQKNGSPQAKGEMSISGENVPETKIRMFLVDKSLYFESHGQWYRSEFKEAFNPMSGNGQLLTAQSISFMLESAESLTVEEVREDAVVFGFSLGRRYVEKAIEQSKSTLDENQRKLLEKMADTLSYRMLCTVDPANTLIVGLIMEMKGDRFEFAPGYSMAMDVRGEFSLSDYGADIRIELPPEAESSQVIDLSEVNPF